MWENIRVSVDDAVTMRKYNRAKNWAKCIEEEEDKA